VVDQPVDHGHGDGGDAPMPPDGCRLPASWAYDADDGALVAQRRFRSAPTTSGRPRRGTSHVNPRRTCESIDLCAAGSPSGKGCAVARRVMFWRYDDPSEQYAGQRMSSSKRSRSTRNAGRAESLASATSCFRSSSSSGTM